MTSTRSGRTEGGFFRQLYAALNVDTQGALAGSLAMGIGLGTLFTFLPPFAVDVGFAKVSIFFTWYTVAAILVRLLFGSLADRFGHGLVSLLVTVSYCLLAASTAFLESVGPTTIGIGLGLVHGMAYPTLNALAIERAAPQRRGGVMSLFSIAFQLGVGGSALVMGALAELTSYKVVFWAAAGVMALALRPLFRAWTKSRVLS